MTNFNVATGADAPLDRVGVGDAAAALTQGELVGYDANDELVSADATSGSIIKAVGAAFPDEVVDTSVWDDSPLSDIEQSMAEEGKTLVGDRIAAYRYGVELVNDDGADASIAPGEPVYLAAGGGYTGTAPSGTGDLVQIVGVGLTPDDDGRERFALHVAIDTATA